MEQVLVVVLVMVLVVLATSFPRDSLYILSSPLLS